MKNSNTPVYPFIIHENTEDQWHNTGLTKREYFAAMAMQGMIASNRAVQKAGYIQDVTSKDAVDYAFYSVKYADALLSELEKSNS